MQKRSNPFMRVSIGLLLLLSASLSAIGQKKVALVVEMDSTVAYLQLGSSPAENQKRLYSGDLRLHWLSAIESHVGEDWQVDWVDGGDDRAQMLQGKRYRSWLEKWKEQGYVAVVVVSAYQYRSGTTVYLPPAPDDPTGSFLNTATHGAYLAPSFQPGVLVVFCTPEVVIYDAQNNRKVEVLSQLSNTMIIKRKGAPTVEDHELDPGELSDAMDQVKKIINLYAAEAVYFIKSIR